MPVEEHEENVQEERVISFEAGMERERAPPFPVVVSDENTTPCSDACPPPLNVTCSAAPLFALRFVKEEEVVEEELMIRISLSLSAAVMALASLPVK